MIRHVVMFRWKDEFSADQRSSWIDAVRALPASIPQIRNMTVGSDVVGSPRSWDAAIVCEFETLDDLAAYADHPDHLPLIAISGAGAEQICSVDFVLDRHHQEI
ncbi:Dabb family protein [Microbacterium sp. NPDC096154]|uniref:Dabb family protein n=1 Tax=Microbacterium sp. NPDC096154 TaxID=3155549 RepID=UPI00332D918B